jgi:RHS repeat-associated protein
MHGLVKTLQTNIYYYQDSLGSTSHIASAAGQLLEYYKYNLYGKPTFWAPNGTQLVGGTNYYVRDLFAGQRYMPELGLYDDRNRFMSPDLGRFLQPDPIGFKGDGSNLYRYCGNDWANRTDPMGLMTSDDPVRNGITEGNPDNWGASQGGVSQDIAKEQVNMQVFVGAHHVEMMASSRAEAHQAAHPEAQNLSVGLAAPAQGRLGGAGGSQSAMPKAVKNALNDPYVAAAMERAWSESNPDAPNVRNGQPGSLKKEQGGWVQKTSQGYLVTRVPGGTRSRLPGIIGTRPNGKVILWFHTHPNKREEGFRPNEASKDDINFTEREAKVPGIIKTYGPDIFIPY